MATLKTLTPFSTAARYVERLPTWQDEYDAQRTSAYAVYEDMYWGQTGTFSVTQVGTEGNPIIVPVAKALVEAVNRYLAVDWDLYVDPQFGTPEEQAAAAVAFRRLFKRENVWSKFATQKRYCLIRGDALWHITADPLKDEGKRISIHELDPASYFPIYDVDNLDRIVGCHIIDVVKEGNSDVVRRQTYRKAIDEATGKSTGITSELALFELAGWDDRNGRDPGELKLVRQVTPETLLPPEVTQLPVYHIKNVRNPADPFGSSLLRGVERIVEAISQTISDEDLAIALSGLGVYVTDAGAPVDENGDTVAWQIAPGRVIELNAVGGKFERVEGITSVEPSQQHAAYLEDAASKGTSVPAVALGQVDVSTAESGIALYLKLSPLLAANAERETEMLGVYDQMLYDLQTMWFPAYEGVKMDTVLISSVVGDPMPTNRSDRVDEIVKLASSTPPLLSLEEARLELNKLGYALSATAEAIISQQQRLAAANDPFAQRMNDELDPDAGAAGANAGGGA